MVKILDRYILKKFLTSYLFVVMILVLVIMMIDITEKSDDFLEHQLTFKQIARYYLDFIPWIANLITPITVFIATVFITSKLAGHTEIVAMLSSGISFRRLLIPYLIGAVLIAATSFYMNGWLIPNSDKSRVAFLVTYTQKPFNYTQNNIHIKIAPESYLYIRNYNNHSKVGHQFTLETVRDNEMLQKLRARRVTWNEEGENWKIQDWTLREFDGKEEHITQGQELDTLLNITPKDFESNKYLEQALTIDELNETINLLRSRGADNVEIYVVEKYMRYMSPFAIIILTFMGVIVSARKARGGTGFQIAFGFLIAFIFIICFMLSREFALKGVVPPMLGVWLPNIFFTMVALVAYRTVPR
jgi:lipopolysaccharide export system permease protein